MSNQNKINFEEGLAIILLIVGFIAGFFFAAHVTIPIVTDLSTVSYPVEKVVVDESRYLSDSKASRDDNYIVLNPDNIYKKITFEVDGIPEGSRGLVVMVKENEVNDWVKHNTFKKLSMSGVFITCFLVIVFILCASLKIIGERLKNKYTLWILAFMSGCIMSTVFCNSIVFAFADGADIGFSTEKVIESNISLHSSK